MTREVLVGTDMPGVSAPVRFGGGAPLAVIAGPCVLEGWEVVSSTAASLRQISERLGVGIVFKASFDKANRTSLHSYRGPGIDEGLQMLSQVRAQFGLPVLTDIHEAWQAERAAEVVDIIQIPAFLCRQTDMLIAAGRTGRPVNIKKGQFLSPWDIRHAVEKVASTGNERILLTERGTSFGYQNLVVDFRSLPVMREAGCPVIFDATHSLQLPGGAGTATGGMREFAPHLIRAACAVGVDGLFMEVHPNPDLALSDATTVLPIGQVEALLKIARRIDSVVREETSSVEGHS
ncbi:MAG: 3-deoxy-8-phosphooctulonate synthase [Armatimonadota bacterium]